MYEVYLDGKNLYYPGDKVNALSSAILDRKLDESGRFDIKVPYTNPLFAKFKERVSEVAVRENGEEIWNGEVRSVSNSMRNEKTIYILGELSYLNASSQPQKKYDNVTPLQMLNNLLIVHNSMVEKRKQFAVGIVAVDNENNITSWTTNYEKTLDYIRSEMCDKLNGHLRIRKINGVRYLDLIKLENYGKSSEQPIKFGKNLLDFTSDITSDSIVTVVRPLGAKLEESVIEGIDAYTTISSVNGGKDYLGNQDAIDSGIGNVWETVRFEDISDPAELMTAGKNWLKSKQFSDVTIKVTAIDLSKLNSKIESFELGDSVRIIAQPFGMDKWSYVMEKKLDLLNPSTKHNISIGEKVKKTYTQQISMIQGLMEKQLPQQTVFLELAKKNASEIIKSAKEGNIYFTYDENGVPKEFLIMDTADINTAKKIWRWNLNGLGYSKTGYNGEFGTAMTMDGSIVADYITAGTLSGVEIICSSGNIGNWDIDEDSLSGFDKNGNEVSISPWGVTGYVRTSDSSDSRTKMTMAWESILTATYRYLFG